jgi:hypothetical protein
VGNLFRHHRWMRRDVKKAISDDRSRIEALLGRAA